MKKIFVFTAVIFTVLLFISASLSVDAEKMQEIKTLDLSAKPQDINSRGAVKPDLNFGKLPLYFIFNKGQVNEKAKFYARASRYTLWLTKKGLVFDRTRSVEVEKTHPAPSGHPSQEGSNHPPHSPYSPYSPHSPKIERDVSSLVFQDANKNPEMVSIEKAKQRVNYFIGNDRSKWHCDVPTSRAVLYKSLYKNIDLKVYGIEKQIEYDWVVKPGGNPKDIRFEYKNVKGTRLDDEGNLLIETDFGELIHKKPVCYQKINSARNQRRGLIHQTRVDVDGLFKKIAENTYGFEVGEYDKNSELIIDPVVLVYSTYLGGNSGDEGYGIAVGKSGNAYVVGRTPSVDFPILNQLQSKQYNVDAFVTKIDTTQSGASSLIYSTYLGGNGDEDAYGIAVDSSENAYVTGYTSSTDFPVLNQYQTDQGDSDAFVTKIDTTKSGASSLIYSTYLGGGSGDGGNGIAVDSSGCVYVTGGTGSTDFPVLNQYQTDQGGSDVFVTKIDTTKSGAQSLIYSTYLGGNQDDGGSGIAVDSGGNVYVTGETKSTDFPILNQFQIDKPGSDVFVTKLDTTQGGASSLIYSTYLGGNQDDVGRGIAVDNSGNAYVTGYTKSTDFPVLNQYQTDQGGDDAFATKIDTTKSGASSLIYSTYLGGNQNDGGTGAIAVDVNGYTYLTGTVGAGTTDFPILNQYQTDQGWADAFITSLDMTKSGASSLIYSTYLGGGDTDQGRGIAVDSSGNVYVTGETWSIDFPTLNQYQADPVDNSYDAFMTKLS